MPAWSWPRTSRECRPSPSERSCSLSDTRCEVQLPPPSRLTRAAARASSPPRNSTGEEKQQQSRKILGQGAADTTRSGEKGGAGVESPVQRELFPSAPPWQWASAATEQRRGGCVSTRQALKAGHTQFSVPAAVPSPHTQTSGRQGATQSGAGGTGTTRLRLGPRFPPRPPQQRAGCGCHRQDSRHRQDSQAAAHFWRWTSQATGAPVTTTTRERRRGGGKVCKGSTHQKQPTKG